MLPGRGWGRKGGIPDENKAGGNRHERLVPRLGNPNIFRKTKSSSSVRIFEFRKFEGKIFVDNLNLIPAENFQRSMLGGFNLVVLAQLRISLNFSKF